MRTIIQTEGITELNGLPLAIWEIYKNFSIPIELPHYDYTIIGLRAEQPIRVAGGIKTENSYSIEIEGSRVSAVTKFFNYIYEDPDPAKVGLWLEHVFYNTDGLTEGLTKIEFKPLSLGEIANVRRRQRQYAISRLDAIGLIMPELAGDLETLREHYNQEILFFEKYGSNDFQDAILAETDPAIITILDKVITYGGLQYTVRDAILEQTNPHYTT